MGISKWPLLSWLFDLYSKLLQLSLASEESAYTEVQGIEFLLRFSRHFSIFMLILVSRETILTLQKNFTSLSLFSKLFKIVPSFLSIIGVTVIFVNNSFFRSLAKSVSLSSSSSYLIIFFFLNSGTARSTCWHDRFPLVYNNNVSILAVIMRLFFSSKLLRYIVYHFPSLLSIALLFPYDKLLVVCTISRG